MEKIAVVGFKGKMGSAVAKELKKEFEVVGIGRGNNLEDFEGVNLVVDFGSHESSLESARYCEKKNIPLVIGSTGQTKEELDKIEKHAQKIKIVRKANFSQGIEMMKCFIQNILKLAPSKIEIIEKHHIHKKDKPSGTALELADYIFSQSGKRVEIKSVRKGEEMGEHEIIAWFGNEKLSIKHNVYSREAFVKGAVDEIKKILKN